MVKEIAHDYSSRFMDKSIACNLIKAYMTETRAKKIFEQYNPAGGVVRCPNGRAKMRRPLDLYAKEKGFTE
jgi:hypothetical protein